MFLHDRPEDNDIRFGHKVLAKWLADRIVQAPSPYRLGITAQLGTGKSTIVEKAVDLIAEDLGKSEVKTAYVDVWKLDKENVRRSALIKIGKDLLNDRNFLLTQKSLIYESVSEENKDRSFKWRVDTKILVIRPAIVFASFFTISVLSSQTWNWISSGLVGLAVAFVDLSQNFFKTVLVRSKITSARAPWIGSEEFEEGLQQILEHQLLFNKQVVIVFDNIDRAHSESTKSILSGISAFFDHSHRDRIRNIKIIVPYDPSCLSQKLDTHRPLIEDCEKMFDAIITLPKLTREDLTDFASDKFKECLSDFGLANETLKDLAILTDQSPYSSPRSIKHLANQFSGLFNLSDFFEKNVEDRIQGSPTLLPGGSITRYPATLLKFLICDKISPGFLEKIVSLGVEPKIAFEDEEFIKFNFPESSELLRFLSGTKGIPQAYPLSATAFLFLKGPDQVLSVAGGAALSDAFYINDLEKLRLIAYDGEKRKIDDSSFEAIIRFHRTKFASNKQVIKNTVFSFMKLFANEPHIEKGLAQVLCESIVDIADQITKIDLKVLSRLTREYKSLDRVQKVWAIASSEFSARMNEEALNDAGTLQWTLDFHAETSKYELSKFESSLQLPLRYLLEDEVIANLGGFDSPHISDSSVMAATKLLLGPNPPVSKEARLLELISARFLTLNESAYESIQSLFTAKYDQWKKTQIDWYTPTESSGLDKLLLGYEGTVLGLVLKSWPIQIPAAKKEFDAIYSLIINDLPALTNKCNTGNSRDVLKIISLGCLTGGFPAHHHLDQLLQISMQNAKIEQDILATFDVVDDSTKLVSLFMQRCGTHFIAAIDRLKVCTTIYDRLVDPAEFLNFLVDNLEKSSNETETIVTLIAANALSDDLANKISGKLNYFKGNSRILLSNLFVKNEKFEALEGAIKHFIGNPDESSYRLRKLIEGMDGEFIKGLVTHCEGLLRAVTSSWSHNHLELFKWAMLTPKTTFDSQLQEQIELAIRWGIANQPNAELKKEITSLVVNYWEDDVGFKAKNLIALRDHLDGEFEDRVNSLAKKHGVKEGLFAKLFGAEE